MAIEDNDPLSQAFADQPSVPLEQLFGLEKPAEDLIDREPPDPPDSRKELVADWCSKVKRAKKYWQPVFDRMKAAIRTSRRAISGRKEEKDDRYSCWRT